MLPSEKCGQISLVSSGRSANPRDRGFRGDVGWREFVVDVLCSVFRHTKENATRIMLHVHHTGVGVAGIYPYEIAEMKARLAQLDAV